MIKFGTNALKVQVRIRALARRAAGAELVCFSRLKL